MTAGVYGKLPAYPDFIHRKLPHLFVESWDEWLQQALRAAKAALGEDWELVYLKSPVWCFSIDQDVIGETGWGGILATSVDSVGRFYPFTIAMSLPRGAPASHAAQFLQSRLQHFERLALSAVGGETSVDDLMAEVVSFAEVLSPTAEAADMLVWRNKFGTEVGNLVVNELFPALSELRISRPAQAASYNRPSSRSTFWWHYGWPKRAPEALRFRGLPDPETFCAFLDGLWERHGWQR